VTMSGPRIPASRATDSGSAAAKIVVSARASASHRATAPICESDRCWTVSNPGTCRGMRFAGVMAAAYAVTAESRARSDRTLRIRGALRDPYARGGGGVGHAP
jgi:hypothetical protein